MLREIKNPTCGMGVLFYQSPDEPPPPESPPPKPLQDEDESLDELDELQDDDE
jgi:hypothetical protein